MPSSFDAGGFPAVVLDQTFMGLEGEVQSIADILATKITVQALTGTLPVESSISSLSKNPTAGLAEGAEIPDSVMDFTSASYTLLRYAGAGSVTDGEREHLRSMGYEPLTRAARKARAESCAAIDNRLNTVLTTAGSTNASQATTNGAWSATSSTPIADIQLALRECGKGDTLFLGGSQVEDLVVHPDFTAQFSNFAGGAITEGQLANLLTGLFPSVKMVVLGSTVYNSANPGQTVALAYQFDGTAWVGWKRDLLLIEQGGGSSESWRLPRREATAIRFTRRVDIVRPHLEMGCVITGVV